MFWLFFVLVFLIVYLSLPFVLFFLSFMCVLQFFLFVIPVFSCVSSCGVSFDILFIVVLFVFLEIIFFCLFLSWHSFVLFVFNSCCNRLFYYNFLLTNLCVFFFLNLLNLILSDGFLRKIALLFFYVISVCWVCFLVFCFDVVFVGTSIKGRTYHKCF